MSPQLSNHRKTKSTSGGEVGMAGHCCFSMVARAIALSGEPTSAKKTWRRATARAAGEELTEGGAVVSRNC